MADKYLTAAGDTWDKIAFTVYGDEKQIGYLMAANRDAALLATVIFDAGAELMTPEPDGAVQSAVSVPPWRTS